MSEREVSITEDYKVASLLGAMNSSELTALEVTVAFSKRAAIAGQLVSEVQFLALKSGANFLCAIKIARADLVADQLSHRDLLRASSGES